jgi:hypothetical protein
MRESKTLTAKAVPHANGCVKYSSVSGSSSSSWSKNCTLLSFTSSAKARYTWWSPGSTVRTGDHGDVRAVHRAAPLQNDGAPHGGPRLVVPVALAQHPDRVVEGHGLDVERRQDRLLVSQGRVVVARHLGGEDAAHVAQVDVDGAQVSPAQRRPLQVKNRHCGGRNLGTWVALTFSTEILGRFCSIFHSLRM